MKLNVLRFTLLTIIGLCTYNNQSFAQKSTLNGRILDEKKQPLAYTSVVLLNASDSSSVQFILSDADGKYTFNDVAIGGYVLQALYNGYDIYQYGFQVKSSEPVQIPDFILTTSTTTLAEALVIAKKIPMVFKGDTIIYNPSAFNTKTNATVEDLLKKLPGVQVGKDGTVTAQGEQVVKVMVNGKEFFGNDPTKATQNIDADAIEKVEILERKDDKTTFTGVDDGTREKVINLVLKESANKGYFGKLEAGGGTQETYKVKGVINHFNKDNQLTLIGNLNNLNQNGFSWREYYQMLNGANGVNLGNNTYWYNQNDWLGANEQGRQQNAVVGSNAHLKAGKGEVDFSYFLMDRSNKLTSTTSAENYLPQRTIFSNSGYNANTFNGQHKVLGHYRLNADTLNYLELNGELDYKTGDGSTNSYARNESSEGSLLNNSLSQTMSNQTNLNYKGKLAYIRKFKNNKHALTLESGAERNESDNTESWANKVANAANLDYNEILPQQFNDDINATGTVFYNKLSFNYHIKNKTYLGLTIDNKMSNDVFNQARINQISDTALTLQSPKIKAQNTISKADLLFSKTSEKEGWNSYIGLAVAKVDVNRDLTLNNDSNFKNSYAFVLPHMYFSYRKAKKGRIGIWIGANENLPSMTQINPVANVSNPMRLNGGNFQVDPTITYNAGSHFSLRNPVKNTSLFGNINGGVSPNAVIIKETRDSNNFGTTTYVNHKTTKWYNQSLSYQYNIKKLKMEISHSISFNHYDFYSILNDQSYQNKRNTFNIGTDFEFDFDKLTFDLGYNPSYSIQNSDLLENAVKFWKHNISGDVQYQLTKFLEINSEYNLYYFNSQQVGQQQLVPILNAGIDWKLDSLQKWTIGIIGYDMLKKAQSINRNFFGNAYSETRQNTITRFFMFNVTYAIKKGKKKEEHNRHWDY